MCKLTIAEYVLLFDKQTSFLRDTNMASRSNRIMSECYYSIHAIDPNCQEKKTQSWPVIHLAVYIASIVTM